MNGQKIVDTARAEIGQHDGANHDNKYGIWFGLNHVQECGEFVSWVYAHSGFSLGTLDFLKGFASVPFALNHFTKTGEVTHTPQAGDIVIFSWDGHTPNHVGIYLSNDANTIHSIDGDTTNPNAPKEGNEGNGGWVQEKSRPIKFVLAYIHPRVLDSIPKVSI